MKSIIGYFAFNDSGDIIFYKLFKRSPRFVIKRLKKEKYDTDFLDYLKGFKIVEDDFGKKIMRKKLRELALSLGFANTHEELNKFIVELGIELSKEKLRKSITRDKLVIQASKSLESLKKSINLLTEHFKEWYWLHYPELRLDNEKIIELVAKYGRRENMPKFNGSVGIEISEEDEKILKEFAKRLQELYRLRKQVERYIEKTLVEIAPNFSSLIEKPIAARLLALAGSLEKLAKMPASTIQLLGAEKALFKHLRNKRIKPPKHGVIFETYWIRNAPKEKRGKIARVLAAKLAIAARIDFYSGRDESERLRKELREEVNKVMKE